MNLNKNETHRKQILRILNDGLEITQPYAAQHFGCGRLAARICELRKMGFDIETKYYPGIDYCFYRMRQNKQAA